MKFVLSEGNVISVNDNCYHRITYHRLIELYELNPLDCVSAKNVTFHQDEDQLWLYPRSEGDYLEYKKLVLEAYENDKKGLNIPTEDKEPRCCYFARCKKNTEGNCIGCNIWNLNHDFQMLVQWFNDNTPKGNFMNLYKEIKSHIIE